jgi:hypothetical protein
MLNITVFDIFLIHTVMNLMREGLRARVSKVVVDKSGKFTSASSKRVVVRLFIGTQK